MTDNLTTDPNDPRLGRGWDDEPVPQNETYLILSEDERKKGFVRPLRVMYTHVGERPVHPTRPLTAEEQLHHAAHGYVLYEEYPTDGAMTGRFWTEKQLRSGCGSQTRMSAPLAETYARDPKFYGSTYCVECSMHRPVAEFVWDKDGMVVGS